MQNLRVHKLGNMAGVLAIAFFVLCMFWGLLLTDPSLKELHLDILKITFPGFSMSIVGVIIAVVESYIYGWVFGALLAWLHNKSIN